MMHKRRFYCVDLRRAKIIATIKLFESYCELRLLMNYQMIQLKTIPSPQSNERCACVV